MNVLFFFFFYQKTNNSFKKNKQTVRLEFSLVPAHKLTGGVVTLHTEGSLSALSTSTEIPT